MKHKFTIKKIKLEDFIQVLYNLYQNGADFIDINAVIKEQDEANEITIAVPLYYMNKDDDNVEQLEMDEEEEELTIETSFLNKLINSI